jgi:heterodisulfide reductase subunit C
MDFQPNGVMRLVQLGLKAEALACNAIWICVGCHACSIQCPVGIDIAAVMDALRESALREKAPIAAEKIVDFHREVLHSIERYGRVHKIEIMVRYKWKTRDWFSDFRVGLKMLLKRKLDLTPSRVSRSVDVKKLFRE